MADSATSGIAAACEVRLAKRKERSDAKAAQANRMRKLNAASAPSTPSEDMTDGQRAAEVNLQLRVKSLSHERDRRPLDRFDASRCDQNDEVEYQEGTGCSPAGSLTWTYSTTTSLVSFHVLSVGRSHCSAVLRMRKAQGASSAGPSVSGATNARKSPT